MNNKPSANQWESAMLAAAMGVAGVLCLLGKLDCLINVSNSAVRAIFHSGPMALALVGACLVLAEERLQLARGGNGCSRGGNRE